MLGIVFMFVNPYMNHTKFYDDSYRIIHAQSQFSIGIGSYDATSYVLRPLHDFLNWTGLDVNGYSRTINEDFFVINLIYMIIFFVPFFMVWHRYKPDLSVLVTYSLAVMLVIYSPYYGVPNKEIIPFLFSYFSLMAYYRGQERKSIFLLVALMTGYGMVFRQYYYIFVAVFLIHLMFKERKKWLVLSYVCGIAALYLVFDKSFFQLVFWGRPADIEQITNTWIKYKFYDHEFWGFVANRIMEFIRLNVPIELLKISPKYLPHVLFQLMITWCMFKAFKKRKEIEKITYVSAVVVYAFTVAQSFFEPDFGSYFRHKVAIFPFIYMLIRNSAQIRYFKAGLKKPKMDPSYKAAVQ